MRYELKSVDLWAFTKVAFFLNVIVGFVGGIFYAILIAIMSEALFNLQGTFDELGVPDYSIGGLLIIIPFMSAFGLGVFYTMIEVLIVIVYNLVSKVVGGFEFNLVQRGEWEEQRTLPYRSQSQGEVRGDGPSVNPARPTSSASSAIPPPPPPFGSWPHTDTPVQTPEQRPHDTTPRDSQDSESTDR